MAAQHLPWAGDYVSTSFRVFQYVSLWITFICHLKAEKLKKIVLIKVILKIQDGRLTGASGSGPTY